MWWRIGLGYGHDRLNRALFMINNVGAAKGHIFIHFCYHADPRLRLKALRIGVYASVRAEGENTIWGFGVVRVWGLQVQGSSGFGHNTWRKLPSCRDPLSGTEALIKTYADPDPSGREGTWRPPQP